MGGTPSRPWGKVGPKNVCNKCRLCPLEEETPIFERVAPATVSAQDGDSSCTISDEESTAEGSIQVEGSLSMISLRSSTVERSERRPLLLFRVS